MGSLTKTEASQLSRGALEDDAVMSALFEAEALRDALSDDRFRAKVQAKLRSQTSEHLSLIDRLGEFFNQRWVAPATVTLSVALAAVVAFLILFNGQRERPEVQVALSGDMGPTQAAGLVPVAGPELERWIRSESAPPERRAKASLGFDRDGSLPTYSIGDPQRIGFRLEQEARVVVLEERSDGSIVRLFPNPLQSDSLVQPGERILVPREGQGNMIVDGPTGKRKIRILVFPPDVDPLAPDQSWNLLQKSASTIERQYEVKQP